MRRVGSQNLLAVTAKGNNKAEVMSNHSTTLMPKRVLMTADTVGGVWTYCVELIRALGEHDIEVALATMGAPLREGQRKEVARLINAEVFESDFKLEWMEDPWADVSHAGQWLLKLEEELRPDVVHLNGYVHGALPWKAPKIVVGHSCVLSWWIAVKGESAPEAWNRYKYEVARGLRSADLVIVPSKAMLFFLNWCYGRIPSGRVIPNGRDPALFIPGKKKEFILSVGRLWDEGKNIEAVESIASYISWPIYVAGDDKHPDKGARQVNNVYFLGHLSREALASWFANASIYVFPARYEPFGLSVLEAALAECALVLGDIPSLRENWEGAAVFVPPDGRDALRSVIGELIMRTSRRKELAYRARSRALEFTPRQMAGGYLKAYSDVMARGLAFSHQQRPAAKSLADF